MDLTPQGFPPGLAEARTDDARVETGNHFTRLPAAVKALFQSKPSDAQCGFKAITRSTAATLLPLVEDNDWFMDTELPTFAEKLGYRICDLPVCWVDDSDSRVRIWSTVIGDLKGLIRLRRNFATGKYSSADGVRPRPQLSTITGPSAAP